MESLQMFCDIPDIQVNEDGPLHTTRYYPQFDGGFVDRSMGFTSATKLINVFGTNLPVNTGNTQSMSRMERFLEQSPWTPGHLRAGFGRLQEYPRQFDFDQPLVPDSPWPIPDEYQRQSSPDGTMWSVSSAGWSGRHVEDRTPATSVCYSQETHLSCGSQELPYYMERSRCSPELFASDDSCIAMSDVQRVPDEDPLPKTEDCDHPVVGLEYATYDSDVRCCPIKMEGDDGRYMHEYQDSGVGESIRDAESVQPYDHDEQDSEDADYKPSTTTSRPAKRSRRRSSSSHNPLPNKHKRPHEKKVYLSHTSSANTDSHKIKKRTKSKSTSPTRNGSSKEPRAFPCPIALYGCTSTFASKNEWKRHVSSQHIRLGFWRCDLCAITAPNQPPNDFNRKDLFTQHLRRMHSKPLSASQKTMSSLGLPVTEENLGHHQERCYKKLRDAPQRSSCLFCNRHFEGPGSWDERMEHVGRHLEKERKGEAKQSAPADWHIDSTLEDWLREEGLIELDGSGEWQLGDGVPRKQKDD